MTKEEHIDYWLNGAQDDLDAVNVIYLSKRFDWSLFIAHLALEKLLKAIYIKTSGNLVPPKTHNLLKLAQISNVIIDDEQKELLSDMNRFQIETRYPEYKAMLNKLVTKEFAEEYITKFHGMYLWLRSLTE